MEGVFSRWPHSPPPNAALHGARLDSQLWSSIWALAALAVLAHLLLAFAIWRRTRTRRAAHDGAPAVKRFSLADIALVCAVVALFAVLAVRADTLWGEDRIQGAAPGSMQVEVVGQQFVWYFRYPGADARYGATRAELADAAAANPLGLDPADDAAQDDIVTSELVLPAGREVDLRLRSLDVVHGFFVPAMRLKNNALPGAELHVHFTPMAAGVYPIVCTQVCGTGHYRMGATLRVLPPDEFAAWLAQQKPALRPHS